jgi:hypothetical protein
MYAAEQILNKLSYKDISYTLRFILDEDCYFCDFDDDRLTQDMIYLLGLYGLLYIASDQRIILTPKGMEILRYTSFAVESSKKRSKLKRKNI